jgi:PAS domain-containing protein
MEDERDRALAAIVANVPGAIYQCALDPDWTMAVISDEIERISGYPAADFVGSARRTYGSIIHPEDRGEVDRAVRSATSAIARSRSSTASSARMGRRRGCSSAASRSPAQTAPVSTA